VTAKKKTTKKRSKKKTTKRRSMAARYAARDIQVIAVSNPGQVVHTIPKGHKLAYVDPLGSLGKQMWLLITTEPDA